MYIRYALLNKGYQNKFDQQLHAQGKSPPQMDLRIPEEARRYQWPGQTLPDLRYQWHGPTNPAVVEARRAQARAQARASQMSARAVATKARKPPPPRRPQGPIPPNGSPP